MNNWGGDGVVNKSEGLAPLQTMGLKGLKFGFPVAVPKELVNKIPSILILCKYGWKS